MHVEPVTQQPNFSGKLVFYKGTRNKKPIEMTDGLKQKFKDIADLLADKPYDVFISRNKSNNDFYDVAANTSYKKAKNVKSYTVKIQSSIMEASIVDAVKDAIEMYEKYISKPLLK